MLSYLETDTKHLIVPFDYLPEISVTFMQSISIVQSSPLQVKPHVSDKIKEKNNIKWLIKVFLVNHELPDFSGAYIVSVTVWKEWIAYHYSKKIHSLDDLMPVVITVKHIASKSPIWVKNLHSYQNSDISWHLWKHLKHLHLLCFCTNVFSVSL